MAKTIFYLGATGFLSGDVLPLLARDFPEDTVRALVRNPTPDRVAKLQALNPNLVVVEGDLNDASTIVEEASKADIVVNSASSDHWPSVRGTLPARSEYARPADIARNSDARGPASDPPAIWCASRRARQGRQGCGGRRQDPPEHGSLALAAA